jgi:hypothetical protein
MQRIWTVLFLLAPWLACGDQTLNVPDWLATPPEAQGVAKVASTASLDLAYLVALSPAEVTSRYERQMQKAGVRFSTSFDGIGNAISASTESVSCIVHITEADSGSRVRIGCAPEVARTSSQVIVPSGAPTAVAAPQVVTRPVVKPPVVTSSGAGHLVAGHSFATPPVTTPSVAHPVKAPPVGGSAAAAAPTVAASSPTARTVAATPSTATPVAATPVATLPVTPLPVAARSATAPPVEARAVTTPPVSAPPTATIPRQTAPSLPLGPAIEGWSQARWGMTQQQVLGAFPGEARILTGDLSRRRFGSRGIATVEISHADIGGIPVRLLFFFDGAGKLDGIRFVTDLESPSDDQFTKMEDALVGVYKAPTLRAAMGKSAFNSAWVLPNSVVELAYVRTELLNLCIDRRSSQTAQSIRASWPGFTEVRGTRQLRGSETSSR